MNAYPVFVDYLTIRQDHFEDGFPIFNDGKIIRIDSDGKIEYVLDSRLGLEGSYDSRVMIKSDGRSVEFTGNISRYGRKDNLFGYTFAESIYKINSLLQSLGLPPFTSGKLYRFADKGWTWTGARVSRIDITCNYVTGSELDAQAVIASMSQHHVGRQKGSLAQNGATVEYGRGSKYVYGKLYSKFFELQLHKKKKSGQHVTEEVIDFCRQYGVIRQEFTLKSRFLLQNGLAYLGSITDDILVQVYFDRSQFKRLEQVKYDDVNELKGALRTAYLTWKYNMPVEVSRTTFYRHRIALLKYGVDISIPSNIEMMPDRIRTVEIVALTAPDWYLQNYS